MNTRSGTLVRLAAMAILLCGAFGYSSHAQEAPREPLTQSPERYLAVFNDVEAGISTGNVSLLSKHFAPQVAISLRGDESGMFSSSQTYYVLQNFFKLRRFARCTFSTIGESDANPYASGSVEFSHKGTRGVAQVYVALTFVGGKYVMTHMTIY